MSQTLFILLMHLFTLWGEFCNPDTQVGIGQSKISNIPYQWYMLRVLHWNSQLSAVYGKFWPPQVPCCPHDDSHAFMQTPSGFTRTNPQYIFLTV